MIKPSPLALLWENSPHPNMEEVVCLIKENQWLGLNETITSFKNLKSNFLNLNQSIGHLLVSRVRYSTYRPTLIKTLLQVILSDEKVIFSDLQSCGFIDYFARKGLEMTDEETVVLFKKIRNLPDAPKGKDFWSTPLNLHGNRPRNFLKERKLPPSEFSSDFSSTWFEIALSSPPLKDFLIKHMEQDKVDFHQLFIQASNQYTRYYGITTSLWDLLEHPKDLKVWISMGLLKDCPPPINALKPPVLNLNQIDLSIKFDHNLRPTNEERCANLIHLGELSDEVKKDLSQEWFWYCLLSGHFKQAHRWLKLADPNNSESLLNPIEWVKAFHQHRYTNHNPHNLKAFIKLQDEALRMIEVTHPLHQSHAALKTVWRVLAHSSGTLPESIQSCIHQLPAMEFKDWERVMMDLRVEESKILKERQLEKKLNDSIREQFLYWGWQSTSQFTSIESKAPSFSKFQTKPTLKGQSLFTEVEHFDLWLEVARAHRNPMIPLISCSMPGWKPDDWVNWLNKNPVMPAGILLFLDPRKIKAEEAELWVAQKVADVVIEWLEKGACLEISEDQEEKLLLSLSKDLQKKEHFSQLCEMGKTKLLLLNLPKAKARTPTRL